MKRPLADTERAACITKRVLQMIPESQIDMARKPAVPSPNVMSMRKTGAAKLPLDRVLVLATDLACDTRCLFHFAMQQQGYDRCPKAFLSACALATRVMCCLRNLTLVLGPINRVEAVRSARFSAP